MNQSPSTAEKIKLRQRMKLILASLSAEEKDRQSRLIVERLLRSSEWKQAKHVLCYAPIENEVDIWFILRGFNEGGLLLKEPLHPFGELPRGSASIRPFSTKLPPRKTTVTNSSLGKSLPRTRSGVAKPEEVFPKLFYLPRINHTSNELEFFPYHPNDKLTPNQYGILEPRTLGHPERSEGSPFLSLTLVETIDLVFIPGLAFTKDGQRLGRGGPARRSLGEGGGYYDHFLKNFTGVKIGLCFREQIIENIPTEEWDVRVDMVLSL